MQIAVGADVDVGVGGIAWRSGRTPGTVVLQFLVAEAAVAGVVGPDSGVGLGIGAGGVGELVAPNQRPRGQIGRECLRGDSTAGVAGERTDGVKGDVGSDQHGREVLGRSGGRRGSIERVIDGCAPGSVGKRYDLGAALGRRRFDGRRGHLLRAAPRHGRAAATAAAGNGTEKNETNGR